MINENRPFLTFSGASYSITSEPGLEGSPSILRRLRMRLCPLLDPAEGAGDSPITVR